MDKSRKNFLTAVAVLIGTSIGAGFLGIPYVASQSGFFVALFYLILLGGIIFLLNLYLGEVSLRTNGNHQLSGYAEKYLGRNAKKIMNFAMIFGIYAAIIAYLFGIGESLSFLIFGDVSRSLMMGVLFGVFICIIIYSGIKSLESFEKWGVALILVLILSIFVVFFGKVDYSNFSSLNLSNFLLPFGVVLFALTSFFAVPEVTLILKNEKKKIKNAVLVGTAISVLAYALFAFVVVGFKGSAAPEIATFALGGIFVFLGILTMFTSYLALGNALEDNFNFDDKFSLKKSWFLASIVPTMIYVLLHFFNFFSFTRILSIGGVISGGMISILILFIVRSAKKNGEREPEYSLPLNWFLILAISLIFVIGVLREIFVAVKNF